MIGVGVLFFLIIHPKVFRVDGIVLYSNGSVLNTAWAIGLHVLRTILTSHATARTHRQ